MPLTPLQIKEIIDFIQNEAERIQYGTLYIELNVVNNFIVDQEVWTKKRKQFKPEKTPV